MGYDGDRMIAEYNSSNTLQRRYVYGPGTDELLVWYEGTGTSTPHYYHADERGSVIALSNGSGALTDINTYDEYGIPGANAGRFQYTGQQWLAELGMYYYKARIYSPTLGRFMQTDPIGFDGGMNIYAYTQNDPVNFIDPLGLEGETIVVTGKPDRDGCNCNGPLGSGYTGGRFLGDSMLELTEAGNGDLGPLIPVTGARLRQAQFEIFRFVERLPEPFLFFARPPIMRFAWPRDPYEPPAPGWQWRGSQPPRSGRGAWYNPNTGQSLHPDLDHPGGVRPHWDYRGPEGDWRWYEDGTWEQKLIA